MTPYTKTILYSVLLLSSTLCKAQGNELPAERLLHGKWHATCPIEWKDRLTLQHCGICSFDIDPNNPSVGTMGEVDLVFYDDSIAVIKNGKQIAVPMTRNKNDNSFVFTYNKEKFSFRVFEEDSHYILVNKDGLPVVLTKE